VDFRAAQGAKSESSAEQYILMVSFCESWVNDEGLGLAYAQAVIEER
jgi:hypothetical protein